MADKLTYNGKTYTINTDGARIDSLVSTAAYMGDSLPSAELSVDTLNATLRDYDTELRPLVAAGLPVVVGGQLAAAQCRKQRLDQGQIYGSKVRYYHDDSLLGEFRLESIKRVGRYEYSLSCVSAIGLLITSNHYGGIYTGETAAEVMADIVGGIIPYTLAPELVSVPIYGYLRKASRRDNLRDLLFAIGGQIRKDSFGELQIVAMTAGEPYEITADEFYVGGSVTGGNPASEIRVTEHSFMKLATDEVVTLYEGDSAAEEMLTPGGKTVHGVLVEFSDPMHDLEIQNTEILESGVNYAVISGSPAAVLTGRKYTHTERIITRRQNTGGTPNVVTSTACTLVNLMNSELVADRLMAYYGAAKTVEADIVVTKQKPGDSVTFTDPFGDPTTGFISDMELTVSNILKARATLIAGYIPTASGNYYSNVAVVSESGTFTLPAECKGKARIVLIGGGDGSEAGQNGETPFYSMSGTYKSDAGAGGAAGIGGAPGKVFVCTIAAKAGQSFAVKIGAGGAGAQVGEAPGKGGATTFGSWTSEDGFSPDSGYSALLSDTIYATSGPDGIPGGHGNDAQKAGTTVTDYDGTVYTPGKTGQSGSYSFSSGAVAGGTGGYGGGPAIRSNGGNGDDGRGIYNNGPGYGTGGAGGNGADAASGADATIPGSGGGGGHGGGGGGAGGKGVNTQGGESYYLHGNPGEGGSGGAGGNGAHGVALIYY